LPGPVRPLAFQLFLKYAVLVDHLYDVVGYGGQLGLEGCGVVGELAGMQGIRHGRASHERYGKHERADARTCCFSTSASHSRSPSFPTDDVTRTYKLPDPLPEYRPRTKTLPNLRAL